MNDDQLNDLKQFITATVAQSESRLTTELKDELENTLGARIDSLAAEMRNGFAGIADIMESYNSRIDNHQDRLAALESSAA